jgi:DNA processing protein
VIAAEKRDRLRLSRTEGIGPVALRRLLARFSSATEAIAALPGLARAGGGRAAPAVPGAASAEDEIARVERLGGRLLVFGDAGYPELLADLPDAPGAIAVLGDPRHLAARAVALVGARNASINGKRVAADLAAGLGRAGIAVVSGLARGIDAAAHEAALDAGAVTVAAVAGGIDMPYPPEHAKLQARVADQGAVVAEAPLGTAPQSRHFPRRNRIIAGLSLGVVVVEAAPKSGSLITARLALEAGRELFACPGSPLDPRARGTNDLIRQGAHLTETADDVLAHLPDSPRREGLSRLPIFARGPAPAPAVLREEQDSAPGAEEAGSARAQVLDLLGPSPVAVDDLLRQCHVSAAALAEVLLELDLAGRLERLPGNRVSLLN